MTTADGRLVTQYNLGVPTPRDLATSLGRMPRFVGHTRIWWTVLHHVAHVYHTLVRFHERDAPPVLDAGFRVHILLHDSEEAILCDLPTPWKTEGRREQEEQLCERFLRAYHGRALHPNDRAPWDREIREADAATLRVECGRLGPRGVEHHSGLAYLPDPSPRMATAAALAYNDVREFEHNPHAPADSELGCWYVQVLDASVGDAARWKLLSQVAP